MSTDTLPCLSVRQPWAELIVRGIKDIENRTWWTKYRGQILIHTSKTVDQDAVMDGVDLNRLCPFAAIGCIIGSVRLVTILTQHSSKWFEGPYGWMLADAIQFEKSIPYRGQLSIFRVPAEVIEKGDCCHDLARR